jgi:hypothetical protein
MEKTEFKFPDEQKEKDSIEVEVEAEAADAEPQIEVVDDTPPEDQNREPMKEPPSEVTEDELQNYSDNVKKRIQHFSKGYHEERRAKEAALREREETLRLTKALMEENSRLKQNLGQGQQVMYEQAKDKAQRDLEEAKKAAKAAFEAGDTEAFVEAQEKLVEAKTLAERLRAAPQPLQPKETVVKSAEPQIDPKTRAWYEKNPWWGQDERRTAMALVIHRELERKGVELGSDDYFNQLDQELKGAFPAAYPQEQSREPPKPKPPSVVAPASRSTAPRKIVLTKSAERIAKNLGLTLEQYARQVLEDERKKANG